MTKWPTKNVYKKYTSFLILDPEGIPAYKILGRSGFIQETDIINELK